jgi:hypothetical protein
VWQSLQMLKPLWLKLIVVQSLVTWQEEHCPV